MNVILGLSARERLLKTLDRMQQVGVNVSREHFSGHAELWAQVRDLREDLRAFDGQLAAIEEQASSEIRRRIA